jgi:pilus assembly protein CpaF
MRDRVRRMCQLSEICGLEDDVITMNDLAAFEFDNEDARGRVVGHYVAGNARPGFLRRLEYFGLDRAWGAAMQTR